MDPRPTLLAFMFLGFIAIVLLVIAAKTIRIVPQATVMLVERLGRFNMQISTPDYFKVMRTRILRGRAFDASDGERAPGVVVVSASMARALWPGKEAIGECIQLVWDPLAKLTMPACS